MSWGKKHSKINVDPIGGISYFPFQNKPRGEIAEEIAEEIFELMNVNRKLRTVALVAVLLAFSASSALALTASQVKAIKQAVNAVPVPEMPAKAAALVKDAEAKDREAVAVTAVKAILLKHRAAAPVVVAAVIKVAPEVAAAVTLAAADLVPDQSRAIAKAAIAAAPSQLAAVNKVMQRSSTVRGSADGSTGGTIRQSDTPIGTTGGNNGTFVGANAVPAPTPTPVDYTQPRQ